MAVIAHVVVKGVTSEEYDKVRAECGWLDEAPEGGMAHLTWFEGDTCQNIDAWESEEAFGAFAENKLGPAMARVGVTAQPEINLYPAHEVFLPKAQTVTAA